MKYNDRPKAFHYQRRLNELQEQESSVPDFKAWLIKFRHRDTQRGDFALDVFRDERFPRGRDIKSIEHYLKYRLAWRTHPDVIYKVLPAAFRAYQSYLRKEYGEKVIRENDRLQHEIAMLRAAQDAIKKGSASEEESKDEGYL